MDIKCHRCGALIDENQPFCPECKAPQIRVSGAEPDQPVTPPLEPGTPGELNPAAHPVSLSPVTAEIDWTAALPGIAIASAVLAVGVVFPLLAFVLGPMAVGALAVLLYARRKQVEGMTGGMGARIGALTGFIGFVFFAALTALQMLLFRSGQWREMFRQILAQEAANAQDAASKQILEKLNSPEFMAALLVFGFVILFGICLLFSSIGGALGARLTRKKD